MKQDNTPNNERILNEFAEQEWNKVLTVIKSSFKLSEDDCRDIFQDSFLVLLDKCRQGLVTDLSTSLSAYFMRICINKAHELVKSKYHRTELNGGISLDELSPMKKERIADLIALDSDVDLVEAKKTLTRRIVSNLPEPCSTLLWGFFRDGYSLSALDNMLGKAAGYAKVTKFRCQEKFRKRWKELTRHLYNQ